ncbi:TonB-dependent receptor domain-containing protein [Costertonia aggregata]|uniref:TonB-dependent receptor n=1 Tax=Costertonia aggregata TaxID=343403 RepID=A0A7H9AUI6_9FLAO|nr:TonB-dependent receptor [Costertonia aggregata]QLG47139.1 TonB-dependent receptor [Costertonia aggregata]
MHKFLPSLFILLLTFSYGQRPQGKRPNPIKITGTVLDKDTDQPLEYATLVLQSIRNPDKITGGITDINGKFNVEAFPGKYNVRVEYISYKTYVLESQTFQSSTDLGIIKLGLDVAQLEAVEVVGEKTSVEVRLDKKIYNVGKDLTNSGATISDALDNIPSVTVDVDGAIALRGNGNVRILINGRPSALAGFGSTDALQQLPADAIEKVEVITSPSARYDAEGTAGILNIVLKKEKTRGFNGTINTNIGYPERAGITANLNLRTNKFNLFNTIGYSYRRPPGNGFFDNTYFDGAFDRIIEDRDIIRSNSGFNANLGIEYFLTESSSLTASIFGRINDGEDITENNTTRFVSNSIDSRTLRREIEIEDEKSYQLSINYNNDFNDEGHKLTADFQYSYDEEVKPTTIIENNTFPNEQAIASENINEIEKQNEVLIQADYVLPMGDAQFEAGYRGNFEENDNDFSLEELNLETNIFVPNLGLTNRFIFNQNVNAVYAQYGNKYGKFSFLTGLRLENTQLKGEVIGVDVTTLQEILGPEIDLDFDKNYLGLFPTVNLTYELAENENITLGYNRRINRPRGWFINPFPSRSSRTNVFQGNPDLDPAFANAFDLGYLKRWKKLTLTSSVYYQKETNSFERIQEETGEITTDGIVIIRSIPINLSTNERVGAELGLLYNPTKWWRINGSFNFFQFNSDGVFNGIDFGAKNTSWFSRFSSKVTLPAKIDWQTNAFYRGPTQNAQTENEGIFSINIALSKDILKDKGTIAFNVSDLLNSRKRMSFTQTPFFTSDSEFQWRERQFTLSFVYRINQKKQNSNNRKRDENSNDDEEY